MLSLAGFTYIFLAEDFCSGVPVSRIEDDQVVYGQPLTTDQVFETAIARFNAALAHPSIAPGEPIHSLASVGLGRALLNQGLFAEAAAAVATSRRSSCTRPSTPPPPPPAQRRLRGVQQRRVRGLAIWRVATG